MKKNLLLSIAAVTLMTASFSPAQASILDKIEGLADDIAIKVTAHLPGSLKSSTSLEPQDVAEMKPTVSKIGRALGFIKEGVLNVLDLDLLKWTRSLVGKIESRLPMLKSIRNEVRQMLKDYVNSDARKEVIIGAQTLLDALETDIPALKKLASEMKIQGAAVPLTVIEQAVTLLDKLRDCAVAANLIRTDGTTILNDIVNSLPDLDVKEVQVTVEATASAAPAA